MTKLMRPAQYEARARIAKALGHPTRLLLLDVLRGEERCVCELTELAGVEQPTASKHLAILREAGLVTSRRDGTMVFYRASAPCLHSFFKCLETVLENSLRQRGAGR